MQQETSIIAASTWLTTKSIRYTTFIFFILHNPFNGPLSGSTRVGRYQKGKTNFDFTEARNSEWQWHQLGHIMQVCLSLQTDNHASTPPLSFLQAGCPYCCPTNSVKALKANIFILHKCKIHKQPRLLISAISRSGLIAMTQVNFQGLSLWISAWWWCGFLSKLAIILSSCSVDYLLSVVPCSRSRTVHVSF